MQGSPFPGPETDFGRRLAKAWRKACGRASFKHIPSRSRRLQGAGAAETGLGKARARAGAASGLLHLYVHLHM